MANDRYLYGLGSAFTNSASGIDGGGSPFTRAAEGGEREGSAFTEAAEDPYLIGMSSPATQAEMDSSMGVKLVAPKSNSSSNRNIRNNNIGNIKKSSDNWEGAVGSDSGGKVAEGSFVQFSSPQYGVRALTKDLTTKRKRGLNTIGKILPVYAPNGKENDTKAYISSVVSQTGIGADQVLTDADMFSIITAIGRHEGDDEGYYTPSIIKEGMSMAGY